MFFLKVFQDTKKSHIGNWRFIWKKNWFETWTRPL